MLIVLKNKDTLIVDDFTFKCSIGKNGLSSRKKEGDGTTPKGIFSLGKVYYRADKVKKPVTQIPKKIIKKNMIWCDNPKDKFYNKETIKNENSKYEKLFRKSDSYDYLVVINYNTRKIISTKGSAIFIHLTKNYKETAGCIALRKKDFLILLKLINKNTKIKIT
jgi:L,D-peptidoglycan transpeptidase YkuD (ErfK/YbiS/YcfS/YnhG family)